MFGKVMSVVLAFLGISAFAKDKNGKSVLLSVQEEQLKQKYGEKFVRREVCRILQERLGGV